MQDLTVSVAEILGRPGEYRDVRIVEALAGVTNALAHLDEAPVDANLRIESVIEGVLVTGWVVGEARLECARCLVEFSDRIRMEVCELFVTADHALAPGDDAYDIDGREIHLEPMLRDAVTLALPLNPLCRTDCKGLCATCGQDLNAGACGCVHDEVDIRWAPLEALRSKLESS